MKKCPRCGRYTVDEDSTCERCGSPLNASISPATVAPSGALVVPRGSNSARTASPSELIPATATGAVSRSTGPAEPRLGSAAYCATCGNEMPVGAGFCMKCGRAVHGRGISPPSTGVSPPWTIEAVCWALWSHAAIDLFFLLWALAVSARLQEGFAFGVFVGSAIRVLLAFKLWQASDMSRLLTVCASLGVPVGFGIWYQSLEPLITLPEGIAIAWLLGRRASSLYCDPTGTGGSTTDELVPNRRRALGVAVGLVVLMFGSAFMFGFVRAYAARHRWSSYGQE